VYNAGVTAPLLSYLQRLRDLDEQATGAWGISIIPPNTRDIQKINQTLTHTTKSLSAPKTQSCRRGSRRLWTSVWRSSAPVRNPSWKGPKPPRRRRAAEEAEQQQEEEAEEERGREAEAAAASEAEAEAEEAPGRARGSEARARARRRPRQGPRRTLTPPDPQPKGACYPGGFKPSPLTIQSWFQNVPFKYATRAALYPEVGLCRLNQVDP
jgi:hypothetical protein